MFNRFQINNIRNEKIKIHGTHMLGRKCIAFNYIRKDERMFLHLKNTEMTNLM